MNKFLNENWEKLSNELQAPMEKALQDVLKPLADHAFSILDADDVLFAQKFYSNANDNKLMNKIFITVNRKLALSKILMS